MNRRWASVVAGAVLATLVAGCGRGPTSPAAATDTGGPEATYETPAPASVPTEVADATGETATVPEPTGQATEMPEYSWSQLLGPDDIRPIYDPRFVTAGEADYNDDELVMGVVIEGEAKAYPIGVLNIREMVNDELGGIPILVTF